MALGARADRVPQALVVGECDVDTHDPVYRGAFAGFAVAQHHAETLTAAGCAGHVHPCGPAAACDDRAAVAAERAVWLCVPTVVEAVRCEAQFAVEAVRCKAEPVLTAIGIAPKLATAAGFTPKLIAAAGIATEFVVQEVAVGIGPLQPVGRVEQKAAQEVVSGA